MISTIEAGRTFFVEATDPRLIDAELSTAVEQARQHAMQEGRCGILVTRLGNTTFTVAVSEDVPFGETLERQAPPTAGNPQGEAARSH
ncbi:hypothetical protein PV761_09105 [Arthrobacter sp. CC3]|jgi:hypothetical protein|uniref:hypothetical protein n=1 Tax=unclassified Arthrobacter TaxID=235627 RepID=UPI000691BDB3|nr:hypothetical protein [Arthrobacter sp. UNC362MFTsu5.1]